MKHIKTKIMKALALVLSMTFLLAFPPVSMYAEPLPATPTDAEYPPKTIIEQAPPSLDEEAADDTTDIPDAFPVEEPPVLEKLSAENADAAETDDVLDEPPAVEDDLQEPAANEPQEEPIPYPIRHEIAAHAYAYLLLDEALQLYGSPELTEPIFTAASGSVMLATAFFEQADDAILTVHFLADSGEVVTAYAAESSVSAAIVTDSELFALTDGLDYMPILVNDRQLNVFLAGGECPVSEPPAKIPDTAPDAEIPEKEPDSLDELPATDAPEQEPSDAVTDDAFPDEQPDVQLGDFAIVTSDTRVFSAVDETEEDAYLGVFVCDAIVQVDAIEQDSQGRSWYEVCYIYGDDYADGTMKWTEYGTAYVLADETAPTDAQECTVTDFALPGTRPFSLRSAAAMNGFSLRTLNAYTGSFWAGQSGLYGDSGRDSEYLQIASLPGHGKIYATPHYLDGITVYCIEHNLPGPGERISGGGYQPKGPYWLVDINTYLNTPGYSGVVYSAETMHAIAWVLRHTYPFMVLDRSDADNNTWSRVAGQFAIREVIKQLEGSEHVRDYWQMDEFYAGSGHAPGVYLEYARWLAENGIARTRMTGDINVSGKSTALSGGMTVGTVTLTTDADLIRISRSYGTLMGNTAGQDGSYYYLNSGDTISVSSAANPLTIVAESMSSEDEEASFLVGVTDEAIQKVLVPQTGLPYPLKSASITFDIPLGAVSVLKKDADSGAVLAGAAFDLISGSTVLQTVTTGADGKATFTNVQPGTYAIRERSAPEGFLLPSVNVQEVNVASGQTVSISFTDQQVEGKIKIIKTDELTGAPLAGATFTMTRLSCAPALNGAGVGEQITITTDADGVAETGWLPYGRYRVEETGVPADYVDKQFSMEINACENGKTYTVSVANEPMTGYLQLVKTDALDQHTIAGVQFDIYHNDQLGNGLAGTMTTDENGVAISPPLRKGQYIVREHENPTGYVSELTEQGAVVVSNKTTNLSAVNRPVQGKIRITKTDQLTKEALAGAEFTMTRLSGLPSHNGLGDGEVVAVITTDVNGVAVSPLLTWGTYRVTETKVPPHFVDSGFSADVVIAEEGQTVEVAAENEPTKGHLKLIKTDRLNGNPIEGVIFDIYHHDAYGEGLAGSMVTDKNGIAVSSPLQKGQYIVKERGTTAGYVFEEVTLQATVKSDETTELIATNQPVQVRLTLYKRDADEYAGNQHAVPTVRGDGELAGAEFQVLAAEDILDRQGNVIHEKGAVVVASIKTVGEDGSATTEPLWPGLYKIVEVTPPTGYLPGTGSITMDARGAAEQSAEAIITYESVITNSIKLGAQAIVKILGDNSHDPDPSRVETPESGAEFAVYLRKAGSYEAAREFERDYLTTDENGYAMTKPLPYGIYMLEQASGKAGYEIKGPIAFEIDGTESLVNPPPLTLNDRPILYRLRLVKTDAETGLPIALARTSFKLKDAEGKYVRQTIHYPKEQTIDTFTTDDTGGVTLPETLTWGLYFVEEVKAPDGYLLRMEDFAVMIGHEGDTPGNTYELTVEIPNEPIKGCIVLEKRGLQLKGFGVREDAYGNAVHHPVYEDGYLADVTFEIRAEETITGKGGTVWYQAGETVDTLVTTADGPVSSKALPLGLYQLVEVSAPSGYILQSQPVSVRLSVGDGQKALVSETVPLNNTYLPAEITLWKEKEALHTVSGQKDTVQQVLVNEPGEGFVFGLFTAQDIPYSNGVLMSDTLIATGATDENGQLTFAGTYPHGEYVIRELKAPEGWEITPEAIPVSLQPSQMTEDETMLRVLLVEPVHNKLIHQKVTLTKLDITGAVPLPGALIEVKDERGTVIYREYTDENGKTDSIPVTPGRYTFREVYAPEGFALNEAVMTFTVEQDGTVIGDTAIRDDYSRFAIEKHDEASHPLAGVTFSLVNESGNTVMTAVTDANGLAVFEKVPFGTYRVVETAPLSGYTASAMDVSITVDGTFVSPKQPIATVVNHPNEVYLKKVDQDGKPLAGAVFGLYSAFDGCIQQATSDEDGVVKFTRIPYGEYVIKELKAPNGYLPSQTEIPLVIGADFKPDNQPIAAVVNHRKDIACIKVDTAGKPLAGVTFSLIHAVTHEVAETVVSDAQGKFHFTQFDYGKWLIREGEAPEGYSKMADIELTVDENWTAPEIIRCVNIPNKFWFFKSDNHKNALPGVTFALEDDRGNFLRELVSGEDGVVHVEDLAPGSYVIRELEPPDGYARTDETIEFTIDETYQVPAKLKRLVNYPSISTGVDFTATPLTWAGIALVGIAGLVIVLEKLRKSGKRSRR